MSVSQNQEWECIFCGEEFSSSGKAEDHIKDEHADQVLDEEWPRYFKEPDDGS